MILPASKNQPFFEERLNVIRGGGGAKNFSELGEVDRGTQPWKL